MVTKEINLLIIEKTKNNKKNLTSFITLGILMFCTIVIFFFVIPQIKIRDLKNQDYKLSKEINMVGNINDIVKEYKDKQADLMKKKDSVAAIKNEKIDLFGLLEKIKLLIPDKVYITNLSESGGNSININFETTKPLQIVQLFVKLRESDLFENVELTSVPLETDKPQSISFNLQEKNKKQNKEK